jgi:hypothetical protein
MPTILFDKMLAARKLESDSRFTREQAETLAEVFHEAMTEATATKTDFELVEARLRAYVADVRTQIIAATAVLLIGSNVIQHFWH